jgi:UDP-N-acetylmuramate dehydrogenase
MSLPPEALSPLQAISGLSVLKNEPLAKFTRFGLGGPAALLCRTRDPTVFARALKTARAIGIPNVVVGGGSNLVVSDDGFDGAVLQFTGSNITNDGYLLRVESGAVLQDVVDRSIDLGLKGLETMTGIPGHLGGAVYGNAGAYGHSIQELVTRVEFTDGETVRSFDNAECEFRYRDSRFKSHKEWVILSAELKFMPGNREVLSVTANEIRAIRDAKYPPEMKCAGSIFKNVFFADLPKEIQAEVPPKVIREGKIPSAWFLEQTGAKGLRIGDIQVATYHANLIYNDGNGRARDVIAVVQELKGRVRARFGFEIEEEVQYVGFDHVPAYS